MSKEAVTTEKKPKGKAKKLIMISVGAFVLIGAGAGVGLYAAGGVHGAEAKEDPKRPKLVERSEEPARNRHQKSAPLRSPATRKRSTLKSLRSHISRSNKTSPPIWPMALALCKSA
jgi:hypothetical protein